MAAIRELRAAAERHLDAAHEQADQILEAARAEAHRRFGTLAHQRDETVAQLRAVVADLNQILTTGTGVGGASGSDG